MTTATPQTASQPDSQTAKMSAEQVRNFVNALFIAAAIGILVAVIVALMQDGKQASMLDELDDLDTLDPLPSKQASKREEQASNQAPDGEEE